MFLIVLKINPCAEFAICVFYDCRCCLYSGSIGKPKNNIVWRAKLLLNFFVTHAAFQLSEVVSDGISHIEGKKISYCGEQDKSSYCHKNNQHSFLHTASSKRIRL